jgi:hypothetical protein
MRVQHPWTSNWRQTAAIGPTARRRRNTPTSSVKPIPPRKSWLAGRNRRSHRADESGPNGGGARSSGWRRSFLRSGSCLLPMPPNGPGRTPMQRRRSMSRAPRVPRTQPRSAGHGTCIQPTRRATIGKCSPSSSLVPIPARFTSSTTTLSSGFSTAEGFGSPSPAFSTFRSTTLRPSNGPRSACSKARSSELTRSPVSGRVKAGIVCPIAILHVSSGRTPLGTHLASSASRPSQTATGRRDQDNGCRPHVPD